MKLVTATDAQDAYDYFEKYQPLTLDEPRIAKSAFALALQHHIGYWDALYVALAMEYRCDLVTADARLHRAAAKHYPYIELLRA